MLITAKFASPCLECGKLCLTGDRVSWEKGARGVRHAACSEEGKALVAEIETSRATDSEQDFPCPKGLEYLGYQKAGIAYALKRRGTLIADDMGLGKTVQAIGVINASNAHNILIVCPASVKLNWARELERWLTRERSISIAMPGKKLEPGEIVICNYEQLDKIPAKASFDLLIADEAHACKNPKSKRTKGIMRLAKKVDGRVILLTGTPLLNGRPVELWPLLQIVNPEEWDKGDKGFVKYAWRYCAPVKEFHGNGYHWNFNGAARLEELQERLRSTCMVRR